MATTSIWHVKGYLGRVLIYAQNPEKTENPRYHEIEGVNTGELSSLGDVMAYATNPTKTERRLFVSGINCNAETARFEMMSIKRGYGKDGGIVAWHGYQAFRPGETTPEVAHEIGVRLADEVWGSRFQVVVATHIDKGHIHNHFVLNSVSCIDGGRYTRKAKDYRLLRDTSDALCKEYGLSVISDKRHTRTKHYAEWEAERTGKPTWESIIRSDIDECIEKAASERSFFKNLEALGYEYKQGKDISLRPAGKERFFRIARNLGENYTLEAIIRRIDNRDATSQILPVPTKRASTFKPPNKLPAFARGSLVALYKHYLYLMGYFERHGNPSTNARTHYLLRDDIRKLDDYIADTRLLERESIEGICELKAFRAQCESEIDTLINERTKIKNSLRASAGHGNRYTTKDNPKYLEINTRLKALRKEMNQVERIAERSRSLADSIKRIERDEDKKLSRSGRKEDRNNGRIRTSGRSISAHSIHGR